MLFRKTVDTILKDVNKKIDELQALAQTEKGRATIARVEAARQLAEAETSEAEADRALRIAGKIEDLLV